MMDESSKKSYITKHDCWGLTSRVNYDRDLPGLDVGQGGQLAPPGRHPKPLHHHGLAPPCPLGMDAACTHRTFNN